MSKIVRIVEKKDKTIALINAVLYEGEDPKKKLDKLMNSSKLKDYLGYFDTTLDKLPGISTVDKWRMKSDKKGVKIDNTIITPKEKQKLIMEKLKIEYNKSDEDLDVIKILRLRRQLEIKNEF